jgi:hypothetical protein
MRDKYDELESELVKSLTERLLDFEYSLGTRNYFYSDIEVDRHIFDILADHMWDRTAYGEIASELVKSKTDGNAFDKRVRERVYDDLSKASVDLTHTKPICRKSD